jgi:hypothetical protein
MSRYLTKSRFKLATECSTKLFYTGKSDYFNTRQNDSFMEALADGGFQVGELAKLIYPGGVEITEANSDRAESVTRDLLAKHESIVLFEPAIRYGDLFIRIDILVKNGLSFELIEVKAKSYDSNDPRIVGKRGGIAPDMLPYVQDVAFQRYVLLGAYPDASVTSFLLMPDKSVSCAVDGLNQLFKVKRAGNQVQVLVDPGATEVVTHAASLLAKVCVDAHIERVMAQGIHWPGTDRTLPFPEAVDVWATAYVTDQKIAPALHKGCSKCEFRAPSTDPHKSGFHECVTAVTGLSRSQIDQGTVLDLWNYRKKDDLLARGIYRYTQVTEDDINIKSDKDGLSRSQRQWFQVNGLPTESQVKGFYLDRALIVRTMAGWTYPLHMIDFETATVALPFFKGMRPYEPIAFQFSHHVIESDGSVRHVGEFLLAEPGKFPNIEFVRALKQALGQDNGTIFRWAAHENTILNQIKQQLRAMASPPPDCESLVDFIESVTDGAPRSMVDLAQLAERAYFHPDTRGSVSIKRTLPAVLKTSDYLREKYQAPVYGTTIPSLNFQGFTWWEQRNGLHVDPYQRLGELSQLLLDSNPEDAVALQAMDLDIDIAEGGAAAMAFARLQFETLNPESRSAIQAALRRYCELDTLAMVMITEAWREWSHSPWTG